MEVVGEEEEPQHLYNEVFVLVNLLPVLLGCSHRLLQPRGGRKAFTEGNQP